MSRATRQTRDVDIPESHRHLPIVVAIAVKRRRAATAMTVRVNGRATNRCDRNRYPTGAGLASSTGTSADVPRSEWAIWRSSASLTLKYAHFPRFSR